MGEMGNAYTGLVRIPEGRRSLRSSRYRWEENKTRRNLREIRWEGVEWMHLAQDRHQWDAVVNMVVNH
jgi:hypothetical protein